MGNWDVELLFIFSLVITKLYLILTTKYLKLRTSYALQLFCILHKYYLICKTTSEIIETRSMKKTKNKSELLNNILLYFSHPKNPQFIKKGIRFSDIVGFRVDNKIVSVFLSTHNSPVTINERFCDLTYILVSCGLDHHFCIYRSTILSLYYFKCVFNSSKNNYFTFLDTRFNLKLTQYSRSKFISYISQYSYLMLTE